MILEKYSVGIGDRFGHQGIAQLKALQQAWSAGVAIAPVWNKSYREHSIIGTNPADTRRAADAAVQSAGWKQSYYLDADHIGRKTVDLFLESSNFFTIDVADFIGTAAPQADLDAFVRSMSQFRSGLKIPGLAAPLRVTEADIVTAGRKYLQAVREAGRIFRHIAAAKGVENFVAEVSFDEAANAQSPVELFLILAALADEGVPLQTIAPKFPGKFLKGIDYVGSVEQFTAEFEMDLRIIAHAVNVLSLPKNLKLSIHSGSDKFSLYPAINRLMTNLNAGLHLKTAGTTWLEELIGLAASGGEGLVLARAVYRRAYERREELCKPYEFVIDIDPEKLPAPTRVNAWSADDFVAALKHDQENPRYNPHVRQLLHIGYKVAAEMGSIYLDMLDRAQEVIGRHVTENLYDRHIAPLFIGAAARKTVLPASPGKRILSQEV